MASRRIARRSSRSSASRRITIASIAPSTPAASPARRASQVHPRQPAAVALVHAPAVHRTDVVAQQQLAQPVPGAHQIPAQRLPGTDEIAQRLLLPDPGPGPRAAPGQQQPRTSSASRASVLTLSPLARGIFPGAATTHSTPALLQRARQAVPRRPGLVRDAHRSAADRRRTRPPRAYRPFIRRDFSSPVLAVDRPPRRSCAACTSRPTSFEPSPWLAPPMRLWAAARGPAARHDFTPTAAWGDRPLLPARPGRTDNPYGPGVELGVFG